MSLAYFPRALRSATMSAALVLGASAAAAQTFTFTATPNYPGCDLCTRISSVIVPPGLGMVTDVNVSVTFHHTWWGDTYAYVHSPAGQTVYLFSHVGGSSDPNGTYVFDDEAATPVGSTVPGTYRPQGSLAAFDGSLPDGTWTLTFTDAVGADYLTLNAWSLILTVDPINQAYTGTTLSNVVSGDVRSLVGSLESRKNAMWSGGMAPAADDANPYAAGGKGGFWLRTSVGGAKGKGDVVNLFVPGTAEYDENLYFLQGGAGTVLADSARGRLVASLFGHYQSSDSTISDAVGVVGNLDATGYGAGASLSWLGAGGFYADVLGLYTAHDVDVATATGAVGTTDADTWAASLEAGYRFGLSGRWSLVPQAQLVYQNTDIGAFTDSAGTTYAFSNTDSLEGRAGVALEYDHVNADTGSHARINAGASLVHEFLDDGAAVINGNNLGFGGDGGSALLLTSGIAITPAAAGLSVGSQLDYRAPLKKGGRESLSISASLGWSW